MALLFSQSRKLFILFTTLALLVFSVSTLFLWENHEIGDTAQHGKASSLHAPSVVPY